MSLPPSFGTRSAFFSSAKRRYLVFPAFLLGLVAQTEAQTTDSTSPGVSKLPESEAITLTPYEVRTDHDAGYYSPNTLSGGRTNTELKNTPAALTVLNRQFLDDIAAQDIYQAEIWNVNASPTYNAGNATTGSNNRGPNFSFFSRNYFLWYTKSDTYNTERFEFARGPNGVLFGDGNIGGLASTMTKQAYIGKKGISFSARADSYGGYRATADINIPAGDRFALRLNLLHDRGTMWQDHSNQFRDGAHLTGTVKLFDKTNFRFEGEVGDIDRQIYIVTYAENASYWDKTTVYNGVTAPSTAIGGPGVARVNTNPWFVDIPGSPGVAYSNWSTFYRSTGSGFAMRDYVRSDIPAALPILKTREFNLEPPDARYRLKYATSTFYLEHQFSNDLFAQVAYNSARTPYEPRITDSSLNQYYIDVNTVLPTGAPNPNFGKAYAETALSKTYQMNTVSELRAFLAYRFDTKWWKGNINALAGTRFDKFDYSQRTLAQTNGTNPNTAAPENIYHLRIYWDNPVNFEAPNISGRTFDYANYTNMIVQRKFIDYAQLVSVNQFFNDRVTVFLGGRADHVHQTQRSRLPSFSPTGVPVLGATIIPPGGKAAVQIPGAKAVVDESPISKNGGVVYYVIPWLGLYYNYSQTFSVPDAGNNLIDGTVPPVSHSETNEYGFKLNLIKGKLYADVRYYDSKQTDQLTTTGAAGQINAIWTQLGRTDLTGLAYRDTQSFVMNGYEFELVANPSKNWRLIANYSLPRDQRNINALPGLRGYYAEHQAEWKAAAATNATIQSNLSGIDTILANNAAFALAGGFTKYRANFYATYTFDQGALRGFAAGGGTNVVGPAKVGSGLTAFDYLYSQSYCLLSGHLSYSTKIGKTDLKLQLNVSNILNQSEPIIYGTNGSGTNAYANYRVQGVTTNPNNFVPNVFRYNDPRKFILSATLTF